jgi:hypothetical protein
MADRKVDVAVNRLKLVIDTETEPSRMTKHQAVDVLEELVEHCRSGIEALKEEIGEKD